MMVLCAVWNWESRPRKVQEGGLQGATLEGHMETILRTFSVKLLRTISEPVLSDDVIEPPLLSWMLATSSLQKSSTKLDALHAK